MGDKQIDQNNFYHVDAEEDLLANFLKADHMNENHMNIGEDAPYN
jgi:hypothetical protein